jgi:hypothetical protein
MRVLHECALGLFVMVAARLLHALDADLRRNAYFVRVEGQCSSADLNTTDILAESSHVSDTQCTLACLSRDECFVADYCQIGGISRCYQRHNESSSPCTPGSECERWILRVSLLVLTG